MALRAALIIAVLGCVTPSFASDCVECHREVTPNIVVDWELSKHHEADVDCSICHGEDHSSADDVELVQLPTVATCEQCHENRVQQFKRGKHAFAWAALTAMPTTHALPAALVEGMKGCGGCHKIGLKSEDEIRELKE